MIHDPRTCAEGDGGPCAECAERIEVEGIERLYECPWCLAPAVDTDHIRKCSNYKPAYSETELKDVYSDSTDAAKLERMLQGFQ